MGTLDLDSGDMAFMMLSSALVLFMTPGLAFFYGGMVDTGSVLSIMAQSFVAMGIVTLWWWLVGFSLCFGSSWGVLGDPTTYFALTGITDSSVLVVNGTPITGISGYVYCMYQLTFAIITPALMTGGFTERLRFRPLTIFIFAWATCVYAPFAHLSWGGGLFAKWGVWDFAGGTVVHITSGWSALGSILVLGKRGSDGPDLPHNVPFVLLGTAILWFGWNGFNGGSALSAGGTASAAYMTSQLAAASGLWSWVLIDWLVRGKPSLVGACVGAVAGLVVITPGAGYVQPWAAVVEGIIVSVVCQAACEFRRARLSHWLDDTLDVWGTHGVGGFIGAVLVGALSDPSECAPGPELAAPSWCVAPNTATRSRAQLGKQLAAATLCAGYSTGVTALLLKLVGCCSTLKPRTRTWEISFDELEHGEVAYHSPSKWPLFCQADSESASSASDSE